MMRVLSLGAGIQSTTLLLLSARGELPKLDAAIFADTGWEPPAVYEHLAWLMEEADIPIYRVHARRGASIRHDALVHMLRGTKLEGTRWGSMPLFTLSPDGERGMIRRTCTDEYKMKPIRRKLRRLMGLQPGERAGDRVVEQWIGISADEVRRVRESRDYWIRLRYPLIFDLHPPWNRNDCQRWLREHYPDRVVPRSACIGCPFHSNTEWRQMRDTDPVSWQDAVEFDRAIRKCGGMRGDTFLHAARVPLDEAPLNDPDPNQGTLFGCGTCMT